MRRVPIIPKTPSSHTVPCACRDRLATATHASYQDCLHAEYNATLSRFQKKITTLATKFCPARHRGLPYPTSEEVFLCCNDTGVEDDGFEDLGLSDSISAFQVSGRHTVERRRAVLSEHVRGLLDRTLGAGDGSEPRDSVLEQALGATGAVGTAAFDFMGVMQEKVCFLCPVVLDHD